ncbi:MAG: HEAT repeat domain-containing protein [Planctomycetota bacterium]
MFARKDLTAACVAVALVLCLSLSVLAEESDEETPLDLLERGVRQYEKGNFGEATDRFQELLDLRPDSQTALEMRRQSELDQIAEMSVSDDSDLAEAAEKVLEMMSQAVREQKRDIPDPDDLQAGMRSEDVDNYLSARATAAGYGQYAVPYLLPLLEGDGEEAQKVAGRAMSVLGDMKREAVLPLIEALEASDKMVRTRVANVLGQIGDRRAVPSLLAIYESDEASDTVKKAAREALENITDEEVDRIGTAVSNYTDLIQAYLAERSPEVGYVFGAETPVWRWEREAESLGNALSYELVPSYLYYQRQGEALSFSGLTHAPASARLRTLLLATLVRELELARIYSEQGDDEELAEDCTERLAELQKSVPLVLHLCETPVVGMALRRVMGVRDEAASLYLADKLGDKVNAGSSEALDALTEATHFTGRDARYRAAVELVRVSPSGRVPEPEHTMQVIAAALQQALQRTGLIVSGNLQFRNELRTMLEEEDVQGVEADDNPGSVMEAVDIQPNVDVIFVDGNMSEELFDQIYTRITRDGRTSAAPVYVIRDDEEESPDLQEYEGIERVLNTDYLNPDPLGRILEEAFEDAEPLNAPDTADAVHDALEAMRTIDPDTTEYPVEITEQSIIRALGAYNDDVTLAAAGNLKRFGTEAALAELGSVVEEREDPRIRARACLAIASILNRTGELEEAPLEILQKALQSEDREVKEAAAEAISATDRPGEETLSIMRQSVVGGKGQ